MGLPVWVWVLFACIAAGLVYGNKRIYNTQRISYNNDVRPILNDNCLACHGGVRQAGGVSFLFASDISKPAESGMKPIVPGHPDSSGLLLRVTHHDPEERMPLEKDPLSEDQVDLLRTWIRQGAAWETHWAYLPPVSQVPPHPDNASWARNDIDRFVLAQMEDQEMQPSPEADCRTLGRRVSLDLTGLPPAREEIDLLCAEGTDAAYEAMVDRKLDSPQFGEHWASMWLDLARYADSKGYEKDGPRTIWKYRDWVIRAFNEDMPFDQFTVEQLAGDLLPAPSEEQLLATAFHRNTMNNDEGGTPDEEYRVAAVIDRVNTTWEVWMGTTMACVQCHSHPYDPFQMKDYYEFMAYFNNTEDADTPDEHPVLASYADSVKPEVADLVAQVAALQGQEVAPAPLSLQVEEVLYPGGVLFAGQADSLHRVQKNGVRIGSVQPDGHILFERVSLTGKGAVSFKYSSGGEGAIVELRLGSSRGTLVGRISLDSTEGWSDYVLKRQSLTPVDTLSDIYLVFKERGSGSLINLEWVYFHDSTPDLDTEQRGRLLALREALTGISTRVHTPIFKELEGDERRQTFVFNRGNYLDPSEEVASNIPETLAGVPDRPDGGNRLDLAQWMMQPDHPLTGRVAVNRFWHTLFGAGLVTSLEDFGTQGEKPTHPELLDWLALHFADSLQWSVKQLLREMVLSATYRQAADVLPDALAKDPLNTYLARAPRLRLSAEQVRDQALYVSGLLSEKMYGPSVMPYQPEGIWNAPYSSEKWVTSEGEDRHRRGVYTYWRRTAPYPSMIAFDSPSREFCVSRRINTNTPLQALVTLNDPVFVEAAQALANIMLTVGDELETRIQEGFNRVLYRDPRPAEMDELIKLYRTAVFHYEEVARTDSSGTQVALISSPGSAAAWTFADREAMMVVANALLNLDEFLTRG